MADESIFSEEWRECLREHYKHVVRNDPNPRNFESVTKALTRPNGERPPIFTESELRELYLEATMRTEDVPDDFTPDLQLLEEVMQAQPEDDRTFQPHPLECQCPDCMQINLKPHDEEGQPLNDIAELEAEQNERRKDDDLPKQLPLF